MPKLTKAALPLLATLIATSPALAATDQDIAALKEEIARLSQKIADLETPAVKAVKHKHGKKSAHHMESAGTSAVASKEVAAPKAPPAAVEAAKKTVDLGMAGTFPGSFRIPGTETSVKIGGYVKADVIVDANGSYGSPYAKFYAIPLDNSQKAHQGAQTTLTAQQTRLNLETRTPTELGELKTLVEADFYGASAANSNTNGYGLQLRHAYGQIGGLLAGQTWSNFMDTNAMPESLDYVGPAGTIFVRQSQLRYTHALGDWALSASVESAIGNNSSVNTQNAVTYVGSSQTSRSILPDAVVRADYKYAPNGYVSVRGLGSQVNIDHPVGSSGNNVVTSYGFGAAISGKQGVLEKDSVVYDVVYGQGTGRYILDVGASGVYYNSTTNIMKTEPYYGGTLGYQHVWAPQLRSNLFGGYVRVLNDTAYSGTSANRSVASGHINLIWQPAPAYKVGVEFMHGYRRTEGNVNGNLERIETSFAYSF